MAPTLLFDLSTFDLGQVQYDAAAIEAVNPHRGAMRLIDAIIWCRDDYMEAIAYHDIRADAFWAAGHIPGRPIFPGVLMLEAAAQLASFSTLSRLKIPFMGFVGIDKVKFRGQVVPGDRLYVLARQLEMKPRRCICTAQGIVHGNLIFEATITGMAI
jgi:3-hydroxyacyl-[acyl-carrier-protein] dehydratase